MNIPHSQEEHYQKCIQLSQKGDWDSLNELMELYLSSNNSQEKKDARKALKKAKNRNAVIAILYNSIDCAKNDEIRLDLLYLGVLLYRMKFIYDYLAQLKIVKGKIQKRVIDELLDIAPLIEKEYDEIVRYIIEKNDYSVVLYRILDQKHKDIINETIELTLNDGIIVTGFMTIIKEEKALLAYLQRPLLLAIQKEQKFKYLNFLDPTNPEVLKMIESCDSIFTMHKIFVQSLWDISSVISNNQKISIALSVARNQQLSDEQWFIVKKEINRICSTYTDVNDLEASVFSFLNGLASINLSYTEQIYVSLFEKSGLYSNRILLEMTYCSMPYAYRELTNRIFSINNIEIKKRYVARLLKYYREKTCEIYNHLMQLNEPEILLFADEYISKNNIELIETETISQQISFDNLQIKIIDRSIVISDLLIKMAKELHATSFFAAVGFAYTSGLKMLKNVFDEVSNNNGKSELIVGSLQDYQREVNNQRIDKATARYLNELIRDKKIQLLTYTNTFYHGKFYYLSNEKSAYVVIGSSNISKTAFLSNYELDSAFKISVDNKKKDSFIQWYLNFKFDCTVIEELDEDRFCDIGWNYERQDLGFRMPKKMSKSQVTARIEELTDEETRSRLNRWISHNPDEILSELNINALESYIVFTFNNVGIAVFESFIPGNAFYTFKYDGDMDKLLNRISLLSKSEMVLVSGFLMRGYHIQNHEKLENKIEKLFNYIKE